MHEELVIAIAILASAYVQGLSGVGFSLIAAPAIAQAIPGAAAIGLVNFLALRQNSFRLWKEEGGWGKCGGRGAGWGFFFRFFSAAIRDWRC